MSKTPRTVTMLSPKAELFACRADGEEITCSWFNSLPIATGLTWRKLSKNERNLRNGEFRLWWPYIKISWLLTLDYRYKISDLISDHEITELFMLRATLVKEEESYR